MKHNMPKVVTKKIRKIIAIHHANHEVIKTVVIQKRSSFIKPSKFPRWGVTICLEHYEAWYLIGPFGGLRISDNLKRKFIPVPTIDNIHRRKLRILKYFKQMELKGESK